LGLGLNCSNGSWQIPNATSANIGGFSAVCWIFGTKLAKELNVPVGLIQSNVGGTAVEMWSSAEALTKCDQSRTGDRYFPDGECGSKVYDAADGNSTSKSSKIAESWYTEWEELADEDNGVNSTLYNGFINPWIKMTIKGVIWYQGESNVACNDYWGYIQGNNCCMSPSDCADYYR